MNASLSWIKKAFALLTVSLMAATAMPTAASAQQDDSGTLTVTVEVVDEPCITSAELEINSFDESQGSMVNTNGLNAYILGSSLAEQKTLLDLLYWTFRNAEDVEAAISASFAEDQVNRILAELEADPAPSQVVYSPDDSGIPRTHPADRDTDGILSLQDDMAPILGSASTTFATPEFEVHFYAGCRFENDDLYGALFTSRTALEKDSEGWSPVEYVESTMYDNESFDGLGSAWLSRSFLRSPESLIPTPSRLAYSPREPNAPADLTAFGVRATNYYNAIIVLKGQIPPGNYRTQFQFELQVVDPSQIGEVDSRICDWLNLNNPPCFTQN